MSVSENNGDEDLDIYSNLPNFHYDDSLQKLESKNHQLSEKVAALTEQLSRITKELRNCKKNEVQLAKNISCLYKTAKQEIIRKDKLISELRTRNIELDQKCVSMRNKGSLFHDEKDNYSYKQRREKSYTPKEKTDNKKSERKLDSSKYVLLRDYHTRSKSRIDETPKKKREKSRESIYSNKGSSRSAESCNSKMKNSKSSDENRADNIHNQCNTTDQNVNKLMQKGEINSENNDELIPEIVEQVSTKIEVLSEVDDTCTDSNVEEKEVVNESKSVLQTSEEQLSEHVNSPESLGHASSAELPELVGPWTMFSVRKYKQFYGVSPVKKSVSNKSTFNSSKKFFRDRSPRIKLISHSVSNSKNKKIRTDEEACDKSSKNVVQDSNVLNSNNVPIKKCDKNIEKIVSRLIEFKENASKDKISNFSTEKSIDEVTSKLSSESKGNSVLSDNICNSVSVMLPTNASCNQVDNEAVTTVAIDQSSSIMGKHCVNSDKLGDANFNTITKDDISHSVVNDCTNDTGVKQTLINDTQKEAVSNLSVCSKLVKDHSRNVELNFTDTEQVLDLNQSNTAVVVHSEKEIYVDDNCVNLINKNCKNIDSSNTLLKADCDKNLLSKYGDTMDKNPSEVHVTLSHKSEGSKDVKLLDLQYKIEENHLSQQKMQSANDNINTLTPQKQKTDSTQLECENILDNSVAVKSSELTDLAKTPDNLKQNTVDAHECGLNSKENFNSTSVILEKPENLNNIATKSSNIEESNTSTLVTQSEINNTQTGSVEKVKNDSVSVEVDSFGSENKTVIENVSDMDSNATKSKSVEENSKLSSHEISEVREIICESKITKETDNMTQSSITNVNNDLICSTDESSCGSFTLEITKTPKLKTKSDYKNCYKSPVKQTSSAVSGKDSVKEKSRFTPDENCIVKKSKRYLLRKRLSPKVNVNSTVSCGSETIKDKIIKSNEEKSEISFGINKELVKSVTNTSKLPSPTKKSKKTKYQQLKDLFGESPMKIDDTTSSSVCYDNVGNDFNIFNKINPILSKIDPDSNEASKSFALNEVTKLSDTQDSNKSSSNSSSKNILDFKGVLQQGKLDEKTNENGNTVNNENSSGDKENPSNFSTSQKLSPVSTPNVKNVLCNKSQNDENITNLNEKTTNIETKTNDEEIEKVSPISSKKFTPGVFGSDVNNTTKIISEQKFSNNLKVSENTSNSLMSGEDSTINMIRAFSKIGDSVSPIKTPMKQFSDVINNNEKQIKNSTVEINSTNEVVKVTENKASVKNETKSLSPSVAIKCDGMDCSTSEHCEFRRRRPVRKVASNNINRTTVSGKQINIDKTVSGSIISTTSVKRKSESNLSEENVIFECSGKRLKRNESNLVLKNSWLSYKDKYVKQSRMKNQEECGDAKTNKINSGKKLQIDSRREKYALNSNNSVCNKLNQDGFVKDHVKMEPSRSDIGKKSSTTSNSYRFGVKRSSLSFTSNCERRSPSEYFNRAHRGRASVENSRKRSTRSSMKCNSPVAKYDRRYKRRKLDIELSPKVSNKRSTDTTKLKCNKNLKSNNNDRRKLSNPVIKGKQSFTMKTYLKSFKYNEEMNLNNSHHIKRLSEGSESPNASKYNLSPVVKHNVLNFMNWTLKRLDIDRIKSNLVKRFINKKLIPDILQINKGSNKNSGNSEVDTPKVSGTVSSKIVTNITENVNKNNIAPVSSTPLIIDSNVKCKKTVILRKRRSAGKVMLQDSPGISVNITSFESNNNQNKRIENISEENKNVSSIRKNQHDLSNVTKKQTLQKARVVKTQLDFKLKYADLQSNSNSSEDDDVSMSRQHEKLKTCINKSKSHKTVEQFNSSKRNYRKGR